MHAVNPTTFHGYAAPPTGDEDGDGAPDACDVCPFVYNPDQTPVADCACATENTVGELTDANVNLRRRASSRSRPAAASSTST